MKCLQSVCVSRGKKRGFNCIDWTRWGPCMEGKEEEFPMRSAVLLGSKKLLKKTSAETGRGEGKSETSGQELVWNYSCPENSTHTHRMRNFFMSLVSRLQLTGSLAWAQDFFLSGSFVSNVFISYSFRRLVPHVTQDHATQFAEACAKTQAVQWRDRSEA